MNRFLVVIGLVVLLTGVALLPLRGYSDEKLRFNANAGYSDIQIFELNPGPIVSLVFHQYQLPILFSIRAPDGNLLISRVNITDFSGLFSVQQGGYYTLNFSAPLPSYGVSADANITIFEPLIGTYLLSASNCQLRLPTSPLTLPDKIGCAGETGRPTPACGVCP